MNKIYAVSFTMPANISGAKEEQRWILMSGPNAGYSVTQPQPLCLTAERDLAIRYAKFSKRDTLNGKHCSNYRIHEFAITETSASSIHEVA